jgi:hypothetical protein
VQGPARLQAAPKAKRSAGRGGLAEGEILALWRARKWHDVAFLLEGGIEEDIESPFRFQLAGGGLRDGDALSPQIRVARHGTLDGLHDGKRSRLLGVRGWAESGETG